MIPQTTTAQRMIGLFAQHGVTSAMLVQLQHIQELALAINLQGRYLIHLDLFGMDLGFHQVVIAGCRRGNCWQKRDQTMPRHRIDIPEGGDANALRDVQAQLASAAADLMALLEEDAQ